MGRPSSLLLLFSTACLSLSGSRSGGRSNTMICVPAVFFKVRSCLLFMQHGVCCRFFQKRQEALISRAHGRRLGMMPGVIGIRGFPNEACFSRLHSMEARLR